MCVDFMACGSLNFDPFFNSLTLLLFHTTPKKTQCYICVALCRKAVWFCE